MPASDKCTRARHTVAFACNLRLFQHCSSSCLVIVKIHKRSCFRFLVQRSTLLFSDVNKALGKPVMYTHTKKHSFKLSVTLLYFSNKLSDQSDTHNTYIYHSQSSFINTSVSSSRKSSGMKCVERFISLFVTIIIFIFLSGFFMLLFVRYIICT